MAEAKGSSQEVAIEEIWDGWTTEQLETELAEIAEELEAIKSQLRSEDASRVEGTGLIRGKRWATRAITARRFRVLEYERLKVYLSARKKQDKIKKHLDYLRQHQALKTWEKHFVSAARKELPAEWFEHLKACAQGNYDRAQADLADSVGNRATSGGE